MKSITVSGIRCQDMRLRLKYVDIPSILEGDVEKAIRDTSRGRSRKSVCAGKLYSIVQYQKYSEEDWRVRNNENYNRTFISGSSESLR